MPAKPPHSQIWQQFKPTEFKPTATWDAFTVSPDDKIIFYDFKTAAPKMKLEDIKVGEHYLFVLRTKSSKGLQFFNKYPPKAQNSDLFYKKFPNWDRLVGKEVEILFLYPDGKVNFFPIDYGHACWAIVPAEFFQPLLQHAAKPVCQCNLWITGCKCGAFKAEQAKS